MDYEEVNVMLIVVEALRAILNLYERIVKEEGMHIRVEHVQKTVLLGTAIIFRLVLSS